MYFLKKSFLNIIIWMLLFGVLAAVFTIVFPTHTYHFEEYYEVDAGIDAEEVAELNIALNRGINQDFPHKVGEVAQVGDSDYLLFTLTNVDREEINELRNSFQYALGEADINAYDTRGMSVYFDGDYLTKFLIIASSLIFGAIVGVLLSLRSNTIRSEADIREHLNEHTIGTF